MLDVAVNVYTAVDPTSLRRGGEHSWLQATVGTAVDMSAGVRIVLRRGRCTEEAVAGKRGLLSTVRILALWCFLGSGF